MADDVDALGEGLTDDPVVAARVLREVAESFLNFGIVARREAEQQNELRGTPDILVTVPFFDADIFDMEGLIRLGATSLGVRRPGPDAGPRTMHAMDPLLTARSAGLRRVPLDGAAAPSGRRGRIHHGRTSRRGG